MDDLKLSDSFTVVDKSGDYEWTGTVYNLNKPENAGLLKASRPLAEYTELVNRIKRNRRDCKTKEEALLATDEAVQSCIRDGILTEFLEKHRAEVIDVILTEFDEAKFVATIKKEGLREGLLKISRRMRDRGRSIKEIADELGEDEATISEILNSTDME